MICVIGIFAFLILFSGLITLVDKNWKLNKVRHRVFMGWSLSLCCIWLVITIGILGTSYDSYLNERAFYDATLEQYSTAVVVYENKAVIDIESAAWTDLKYQGYQDNISKLILDLRNRIIIYNNNFIKMNKMHSNPFFSWLVVPMDDDMKIIKMKVVSQ